MLRVFATTIDNSSSRSGSSVAGNVDTVVVVENSLAIFVTRAGFERGLRTRVLVIGRIQLCWGEPLYEALIGGDDTLFNVIVEADVSFLLAGCRVLFLMRLKPASPKNIFQSFIVIHFLGFFDMVTYGRFLLSSSSASHACCSYRSYFYQYN